MMSLPLTEFRRASATQIISLGPRCSTSYNLRRYYNFNSAFPFDWWVTPEPALIGILGRFDADYLYDPAQLERIASPNSVRHRDLGFLLHHEFPRIPGQPVVVDNFLDLIETPKARSRYLIDKMKGLDRPGERLLFIRETVTSSTELEAALARLFVHAEWCIQSIPHIPEAGFDWRCDMKVWDEVLGALGVQLDISRHKPFKEMTADEANAGFVVEA